MKEAFKIWKTNRKIYLNFLENYLPEQLNAIPEGFNNNLIWNIGHAVVVQQRLVYQLSGLPMGVSEELFELYKPRTKPTKVVNQADVDELKGLLVSLIAKTESDFENGEFKTYKELTTSTGFILSDITDAIQFNNYHEALHLGYMMSIRKLI